jgi:hypothetical protein
MADSGIVLAIYFKFVNPQASSIDGVVNPLADGIWSSARYDRCCHLSRVDMARSEVSELNM